MEQQNFCDIIDTKSHDESTKRDEQSSLQRKHSQNQIEVDQFQDYILPSQFNIDDQDLQVSYTLTDRGDNNQFSQFVDLNQLKIQNSKKQNENDNIQNRNFQKQRNSSQKTNDIVLDQYEDQRQKKEDIENNKYQNIDIFGNEEDLKLIQSLEVDRQNEQFPDEHLKEDEKSQSMTQKDSVRISFISQKQTDEDGLQNFEKFCRESQISIVSEPNHYYIQGQDQLKEKLQKVLIDLPNQVEEITDIFQDKKEQLSQNLLSQSSSDSELYYHDQIDISLARTDSGIFIINDFQKTNRSITVEIDNQMQEEKNYRGAFIETLNENNIQGFINQQQNSPLSINPQSLNQESCQRRQFQFPRYFQFNRQVDDYEPMPDYSQNQSKRRYYIFGFVFSVVLIIILVCFSSSSTNKKQILQLQDQLEKCWQDLNVSEQNERLENQQMKNHLFLKNENDLLKDFLENQLTKCQLLKEIQTERIKQLKEQIDFQKNQNQDLKIEINENQKKIQHMNELINENKTFNLNKSLTQPLQISQNQTSESNKIQTPSQKAENIENSIDLKKPKQAQLCAHSENDYCRCDGGQVFYGEKYDHTEVIHFDSQSNYQPKPMTFSEMIQHPYIVADLSNGGLLIQCSYAAIKGVQQSQAYTKKINLQKQCFCHLP